MNSTKSPPFKVNKGIIGQNRRHILTKTKASIVEDNEMHFDMINSDDEIDDKSRSIVRRKTHMANMYPTYEHYNVRYNFYNYKKFPKSLTIPIQYKTPTVFLDGLYFALPPAQILAIKKYSGKNKFNVKIAIPKHGKDDISNVFHNLDEFNHDFFTKNAHRFTTKKRYTQKAPALSNNFQILTTNTQNSRSTLCRTPALSEDEYPEPQKGPIYLKDNPLSKKMSYQSFFTSTTDNIYMTLEIKPQYMGNIIKHIVNHIEGDTVIGRKMRHILHKINSEYFEFKSSSIDIDISSDLNAIVTLWIKSSLFIGNENTGLINMKWKICNYKF